MKPQLNMISLAAANMSNLIRKALPRSNPDGTVTLTGQEIMDILTNLGAVSSGIAVISNLPERAVVTLSEIPYEISPEEVQDLINHEMEVTTAMPSTVHHDMQAALADEAGVNVPSQENMERAIAAAAELNRLNQAPTVSHQPTRPLSLQERIMMEQRKATQPQPVEDMPQDNNLITGQTGTGSPTKTISPANAQRNIAIQERLRRHLAENPTAPVPGRPTPAATAAAPTITPAAGRVANPAYRPAADFQPTVQRNAEPVHAVRKVSPETRQAISHQPSVVRTEVPAEIASKAPLTRVGPGARADGYVPAVGTQRDMTTVTQDLHPLNSPIPEEEMIAGRTAKESYSPIPGLNVNAPSPYVRLTDPEFSEFAQIFAQSVYAPDSRGVVGIPHPEFPWNRDVELQSLQGIDMVRAPQGFYGFNPANGGPNHVLIRLDKNLIVWNFNHTPGNCRIFYMGRSNKTGRWYTPEALDKLELFTTVAELAHLRARLVAQAEGRAYTPGGRSLL